ncbi:MAG: peptidyl-prolyl cis-trans isomerase [Nitrospirae bacterium]|nr:peptidyl-prolyl cis-trans isomerase [Nitrospirota bacterium]
MQNKKIKFPILLLLLAAALYFSGCQRDRVNSKKALVTFDNQTITLGEFNSLYKDTIVSFGVKDNKEQLNNLKKDLLNQLIERRLILHEAEAKNILIGDAELNDAVEKIKADYPKERFNEILKAENLTYDRWKDRIREDLIIKKALTSIVDSQINIPDAELKKYYNTHRGEFDRKEEARVRQIVVAKEEEALAIRKELLSGADFAKLAQEKSLTPDKAKGGDLGFFAKGGSMPEDFDVVFTLKVGEISKVVKTPYGFHIFKVEEKRPARKVNYNDAMPEIKSILKQEKRETRYREWLSELRTKKAVKIDYDVLYE